MQFLSARTALLWLATLPFLAAIYMTVPPSPDQSQFDWMAFVATQGPPFYVGSFDMNWPGAMWLHEVGLRIFGVHAWTWRLTDFLLMAVFTFGGAAFLGRAGWRTAPVIFLFLYPLLYITAGGWMAGQRDIIASGFLILACALAMPTQRYEWSAALGSGVCVAAAVLIRPTFLSFILGLILLEALPLRRPYTGHLSPIKRAMAFGAGCSLGIGAAILTGVVMGNLDDWYQQSVQFSLSIYVGEPPQDWRETLKTLFLRSWHWISFLAGIGCLFWVWRDRLSYALILVLGVAVTSALSFTVQNKGFAYHLGGILPVLVLLTAIAFDCLNTVRLQALHDIWRKASFLLLSVFGLLAIAGTASKIANFDENIRLILTGGAWPVSSYGLTELERRDIIKMISEGSSDDETVAIYGTQYEIPYRAKRMPTYRYFTPAADQINSNFEHFNAWINEVETGLTTRSPSFVIIQKKFLKNFSADQDGTPKDRPILHRLMAHVSTDYTVSFENSHLVVYRRQP